MFAYTCGFSVNAAAGGAAEVTSVDLSKTFLDWGERNLACNHLEPSACQFIKQESLLFLKGALKRNRQFDLIICDPPSFGRHKDGVFRIEKDLPELLKLCWQTLRPEGQILLSCNFEKWTLEDLIALARKNLKGAKIEMSPQAWDFEVANVEALMKGIWIQKPKKSTP